MGKDLSCAVPGLSLIHILARYHSLVADPQTIPAELKVTAVTEDGEVMAVEQTEKQIYGVQFHPESVLKMCIRDSSYPVPVNICPT